MSETPDPSITPPPPPPPPAPTAYAAPAGVPGLGPVGKVRGTGISILLYFITFGIYGWFWYYGTHEEMKRHTGQGIGGPVALILAIFVGIVSPFLSSSEVGALYTRAGQKAPVGGTTGLWAFPGIFIIVGPFIWFAKTNGAINDYWKSLGAS